MLPAGNSGLQEKLSTETIQPESRSAFCPGARGSGAQRSRRLRTGAPGSDRPRRSGPGRSRRIRFNRNKPHCIGTLHLTACRKAIPAAPFATAKEISRDSRRKRGAEAAKRRHSRGPGSKAKRRPKGAARAGGCLSAQASEDFTLRTWRPRYMPVLRSTWCGRRSSPEILVLDIGRGLERVGRAAHAAARRRGLSFRNGHGSSPVVWRPSKAKRPTVGRLRLQSRSR